jgi:heme/copper-type cytochrome/quinol oxidase subunit 2
MTHFVFHKNFVSYLIHGYHVYFDSARQGQFTFQRPATQTMEQLTDLHHDIFSLLLFLCALVFYLLVQVVYKFRATNIVTPRNFFFKAHTILEIA